MTDDETRAFAQEIMSLLASAGFTAGGNFQRYTVEVPVGQSGVTITYKEQNSIPNHMEHIALCFSTNDMPVHTVRPSRIDCENDTVIIAVGPRF